MAREDTLTWPIFDQTSEMGEEEREKKKKKERERRDKKKVERKALPSL